MNPVKTTLDNGLEVVAVTTPGASMAVVDVLYRVGSVDESPRLTGMAHLFEHLMFGGTPRVPHFDRVLENAGGKSNAWTSPDFTNFYDILPLRNIDTAFFLESDRMEQIDFRPEVLRVQQGVVVEEFKQTCLNRPYGEVAHHLRRLAYRPDFAYHWPTIGLEPSHIESVAPEDVKQWFYAHYAPNNAILTVNSALTPDEVFAKAREWFGQIPARNLSTRRFPEEVFNLTAATEEVHGIAPQPQVTVAIPMAAYGEDEYFRADTITDVLSYGRSSRMMQNLVDGPYDGLFAQADASIIGSEGPGLLLLNAIVGEGHGPGAPLEAARLMKEQLEALAQPGNISGEELERTLNNFEATFRFGNVNLLAKTISEALNAAHCEDGAEMVARRRRLTPGELAETARTLCSRPSFTLIYR